MLREVSVGHYASPSTLTAFPDYISTKLNPLPGRDSFRGVLRAIGVSGILDGIFLG